MAPLNAAAQGLASKVRVFVGWDAVFRKMQELIRLIEETKQTMPKCAGRPTLLFGIPRGGAIIAGLLCAYDPILFGLTEEPRDADVLIDDICDSGATMRQWTTDYPDRPFFALIDKTQTQLDGWVEFPWERNEGGPIEAVTRLLEFIGEDPTREGLKDTPARVLKAWQEMTAGYQMEPHAILGRVFEQPHDELVILRKVEFYSTCEHHLLPFYGVASVGYIPSARVVGISKLARLVDCYAKRLQIQERLTRQIADAVTSILTPRGVGVVLNAKHACMGCRGVMKPDADMITSVTTGLLRDDSRARAEFLSLVTL